MQAAPSSHRAGPKGIRVASIFGRASVAATVVPEVVGIGRRSRALGRVVVATGGGVLVWASFPPAGLWWCAPLGVAALALALRGCGRWTALAAGFGFGVGELGPLLSFVRVFGLDAWAALVAGEALFIAAMALLWRPLLRLRWWPVAGAAAWVAQEAVRDRVPFGGFPWGRLADAQAGGPVAPLAALGGAPLVSFAVALAGCCLGWLVLRTWRVRRERPGLLARAAALPALAVAATTTAGLTVPVATAGTATGGPRQVTVAVIQGNVPRLGLTAFAQRYTVTRNHMRETMRLARAVAAGRAAAPDVVIWPENSADLDPLRNHRTAAMIDRAARAIARPILVGAVLNAPGNHLRNAGIVWSPVTGPGQTYVKQHLLPFGEYLPFRPELSAWIHRFSLLPKDFLPGHRPGVLWLGPARIADVICFEIADDAVVRAAVRGGGRLLVEQTNDASYEQPGDTGTGGESAQQLQIARLRAIEHDRWVVVASTSGVSAVIAPDGNVVARTGVYQAAYLDRTVPLRDPLTLADRVGEAPELALCALTALALLRSLLRPRRAPDRPETAVAAADREPAPTA